jgi:hypothetical protein
VNTELPTDEWLTLEQASAQVGMNPVSLQRHIHAGKLRGETRHRPQRGRPAFMVRRADLDAWVREQEIHGKSDLPDHLIDLIVPLSVAFRLVGRTKQRLLIAIGSGELRAAKLRLGHLDRWHVRLGDLERWRRRQGGVRCFDKLLLAQLETVAAALSGERGDGAGAGSGE